MEKLNTRLESEGAEFLVLGQLLLHKIAAYKTYTNMPGYDLVATDPEHNTSARIQVKSRWRTGATGFPISNFACDFVVAAFLNRGSKDGKKEVLSPDYFVIPVGVIKELPRSEQWSKVDLKRLPDRESYRENWGQIVDFLSSLRPERDNREPRGKVSRRSAH
ncbi:MAG: hypothetical protein K9N23_16465 [Akkermansiaceae bacterium]|nr:hypothetical protein [Akkermansiaceae bacterium]